jgi:hypothetical protein
LLILLATVSSFYGYHYVAHDVSTQGSITVKLLEAIMGACGLNNKGSYWNKPIISVERFMAQPFSRLCLF